TLYASTVLRVLHSFPTRRSSDLVWGDERVAVDLPVRMVQGDADLDAPVLKAEDLLHAGELADGLGSVRERVDDRPDARRRQVGKVGVVVGGEADDLAPTNAGPGRRERRGTPACSDGGHRGEGGEPVLEDDDVVVVFGNLRRMLRRGRTQRTLAFGR